MTYEEERTARTSPPLRSHKKHYNHHVKTLLNLIRMTLLCFIPLFVVLVLLTDQVTAWNGWKLKHIFPSKLAQTTLKTLTLTQVLLPLAANAVAVQYKLPPIDLKDEHRCELVSSSIGQANAARDKLYDLRQCNLKGQSAQGKDLSGMIAADADFSTVSFKDAQISKAYAKGSKFVDCDFSNVVADRVIFDESDFTNAIFKNAVLSGSSFDKANLKNTDFSDSYLGPFDLRNLCANPSLTGTNPITNADSRESAGCL